MYAVTFQSATAAPPEILGAWSTGQQADTWHGTLSIEEVTWLVWESGLLEMGEAALSRDDSHINFVSEATSISVRPDAVTPTRGLPPEIWDLLNDASRYRWLPPSRWQRFARMVGLRSSHSAPPRPERAAGSRIRNGRPPSRTPLGSTESVEAATERAESPHLVDAIEHPEQIDEVPGAPPVSGATESLTETEQLHDSFAAGIQHALASLQADWGRLVGVEPWEGLSMESRIAVHAEVATFLTFAAVQVAHRSAGDNAADMVYDSLVSELETGFRSMSETAGRGSWLGDSTTVQEALDTALLDYGRCTTVFPAEVHKVAPDDGSAVGRLAARIHDRIAREVVPLAGNPEQNYGLAIVAYKAVLGALTKTGLDRSAERAAKGLRENSQS